MWRLQRGGRGTTAATDAAAARSSSGATPLLIGCAAVQQRHQHLLRAVRTAPAPATAAAAAAAWDSSSGQAVLKQHQQREPQRSNHASRRQHFDYAAQPRLLTTHIKQCDAWQQLPVLLDAAGSHAVNHIHLAAALTHAAQLQQQQQQDGAAALQWALQASQQLVQQHRDSLEVRHAANTLWALAALARAAGPASASSSQVPAALLDELLLVQQRLWQQQQEHGPVKLQDCSNSLWALATLQHQPPASWLSDVWAVSLQQLAAASNTSSSNILQEVANLLWAAAALRLQPPEQWMEACLAAAATAAAAAGSQTRVAEAAGRGSSSSRQRAHGGTAQALANISYVLARLQYQPDAAWMACYLSTSRAVLQRCSPAHLCMMLWGVATWGCSSVPPEPAAAIDGDAEGSSSSSQTQPGAAGLLQEWMVACSSVVQQQLPGFSDHGLVGAAVSCHKLLLQVQRTQQQQQPALVSAVSQLLAVLLDAAAGRMQAMQPAWVGALVWASAGLEQAGTLSAQGLGRPPQEEVREHQLQPQQLQPRQLGEYLQHAMAGAQPGSQGPDTLLCLLFLAAKARCLPASSGAWLQQHVPQLQQQLSHLRPPQLAQLCWSLAALLEVQRVQPSWQQGQQQQQEWLLVLASSLLQHLPPALGSMSQAELLEGASSAARIAASVQALQAGTSSHSSSHSSSSRDVGPPARLLPALAAAATPLTASLHPRQLLQLAQAVRLLLKCSAGPPTPAAELQAVHTWLDAAAQRLQAHVSAGLPAAAAGQLAVQLLAVGKAADRAAAGQPASRATRAGKQQHQQQRQQESRQPHHAWCAALQDVLAQTVHQLQGPAVLQLAALSVRLECALPAGVLCDLLYSLTAAVPGCSPAALQELLRLLPAWRSVPPAAAAARKALLSALLGATEQRLSAQLQQLQAAPASSQGSDPAWVACDAADYLQLLARSRLRPPQGWLAAAVGCLMHQLPGLPADAVSRVPLWLAMVGAQLEAPVQQRLLQATQALLPQLGRSQLVRVAHGLSRLGAVPSDDWLAAFYARAESAPGAFQASGFGMVVWALARFGARPEPAWMSAQLDSTFGGDAAAASPGQQQQLTPQHLANMLCAFAKLGFTPGQRWMAWFAAALSQAGGAMQELDHFHIEWAWRELAEGRHRVLEGGGGLGGDGRDGS